MEKMEGLLSKKCPLCNFHSPNIPLLLSHLRSVHSSDPHFVVTCGLDGCTVSSRSFSALYSHVYRQHPNIGVVKKRQTSFTPYALQQTNGSEHQDIFDHPFSDSLSDDLTGK